MRREPWDWPEEPRRGRRSRSSPPLEGEVLLPDDQPSPRIHRVEVHHHHRRSIITPQMVTIAALVVLVLILIRSPAALLMAAVLVPATVWLALGIIVAILVVAALRERWHRPPF
jgi:hypothetical protein